jgi:hypothetical protein
MVCKKMFLLVVGLLYYAPHTSGMGSAVTCFTAKRSQEKKHVVSEFIINDINNTRTKKIIESLKQYEKRDLQNQLGSCGVAAIAGGTLTYMGIPEVGIFPLAIGTVGGAYTAMILGLHNAGYSYLHSAENTPEQCNLLTLAGRNALQCSIQKTRLDHRYTLYPNGRVPFKFAPLLLFNAQENITVEWKPNHPACFKKIIIGTYNSENWSLMNDSAKFEESSFYKDLDIEVPTDIY